jgi:hypothetical protein
MACVVTDHGQGLRIIQAVERHSPTQAVAVLRKIWTDGKFPLHNRDAIQALGRIATPDAVQTLIDVWGSGADFDMALVAACGCVAEADKQQAALEWWNKNKHRSRMELLVDAVEADRYDQVESMRSNPQTAVRELMRRLAVTRGQKIEPLTKALEKLTGLSLGVNRAGWMEWWKVYRPYVERPSEDAGAPTAKNGSL